MGTIAWGVIEKCFIFLYGSRGLGNLAIFDCVPDLAFCEAGLRRG